MLWSFIELKEAWDERNVSDSTLLFCSQDPDSRLQIGGLLKLMAQASRRIHSSLGDILKQLFYQIPLEY